MNSWTSFTNRDDEIKISTSEIDVNKIVWLMTNEQQNYYVEQFKKVIPINFQKVPGLIAKEFFELSKLDIDDLRKIWELADQDKDGCLTLGEFCIAMHLVVLRKNGLIIPAILPIDLVQYLNLHLSELDKDENSKIKTSLKDPKILKRLPSNSSLKSDAVSLTEDMTAFDNEPPQGDKISYPVAFKPNQISSILNKPVGPSQLLLENKKKTPLENICSKNIENINLKNNIIQKKINDFSYDLNTPPVPPRSRWPTKLSENSNSFSVYDDNIHCSEPLLDKNHVENISYGINFSQSPEAIVMTINSNSDSIARKEAYNFLINTTKMQCETLNSMNEEMSRNLKQLQQQRILLEITLEKMMPLNYI